MMEEDEVALVDSEDLESCSNVFAMPPAFCGFFVFSEEAPCLRLAVGVLSYVGLRCVPMGWTVSVGPLQNMIRNFVFRLCQIEPHLEETGAKRAPKKERRWCACTVSHHHPH